MEPAYAANQGYGYNKGGQKDPSAPYRSLNDKPQYCRGCGLAKNRRFDRGYLEGLPTHPSEDSDCPYATLRVDGWKLNYDALAVLDNDRANVIIDVAARFGAISGTRGDNLEKIRQHVKDLRESTTTA